MKKLYTAFVKSDMSLLEINPLIVTEDGRLVCADAKVSFDSNASFRHPEWAGLRDLGEEDEREIEASKYDLSYIALDGEIGCMVNGAGLAMATMDIIKLYGAEPANFLDVGGGASAQKVAAAFKIITADPNVEGILVNIFGGIARCTVEEGEVTALEWRRVWLQPPRDGAAAQVTCSIPETGEPLFVRVDPGAEITPVSSDRTVHLVLYSPGALSIVDENRPSTR